MDIILKSKLDLPPIAGEIFTSKPDSPGVDVNYHPYI